MLFDSSRSKSILSVPFFVVFPVFEFFSGSSSDIFRQFDAAERLRVKFSNKKKMEEKRAAALAVESFEARKRVNML